jgi:hypothetical protein
MQRMRVFTTLAGLLLYGVSALAFDQQHALWDQLVHKHVSWINNGSAAQVDYAGFKQDRRLLDDYLQSLSAVSRSEFAGWSKTQQLAFLINAYNAFTVDLILSKYPDLQSIKDLGSFLSSPWKKEFFSLFGEQHHLDYIEHELIRAPGVYNEPRIHFAVVCASIGCPALRNEAFIADKLNDQLEDSMRRFLADRSRNRYNPATGKLEVSKLFDWYGDDFGSLKSVLARYAELLADDPQQQQRIRDGEAGIVYLDYDWGLNDKRG